MKSKYRDVAIKDTKAIYIGMLIPKHNSKYSIDIFKLDVEWYQYFINTTMVNRAKK